MADALDQLRPILAKLKREKSIAQSRVEDLENQVHNDSIRYDRAAQNAEGGQRDSSRLLREEQEKRKGSFNPLPLRTVAVVDRIANHSLRLRSC